MAIRRGPKIKTSTIYFKRGELPFKVRTNSKALEFRDTIIFSNHPTSKLLMAMDFLSLMATSQCSTSRIGTGKPKNSSLFKISDPMRPRF